MGGAWRGLAVTPISGVSTKMARNLFLGAISGVSRGSPPPACPSHLPAPPRAGMVRHDMLSGLSCIPASPNRCRELSTRAGAQIQGRAMKMGDMGDDVQAASTK